MLTLIPHHRLRISNRVAIFAAVLLLVSSYAGYETQAEDFASGADSTPAANAVRADAQDVDETAEPQRRGLKLSLRLFRRG